MRGSWSRYWTAAATCIGAVMAVGGRSLNGEDAVAAMFRFGFGAQSYLRHGVAEAASGDLLMVDSAALQEGVVLYRGTRRYASPGEQGALTVARVGRHLFTLHGFASNQLVEAVVAAGWQARDSIEAIAVGRRLALLADPFGARHVLVPGALTSQTDPVAPLVARWRIALAQLSSNDRYLPDGYTMLGSGERVVRTTTISTGPSGEWFQLVYAWVFDGAGNLRAWATSPPTPLGFRE